MYSSAWFMFYLVCEQAQLGRAKKELVEIEVTERECSRVSFSFSYPRLDSLFTGKGLIDMLLQTVCWLVFWLSSFLSYTL